MVDEPERIEIKAGRSGFGDFSGVARALDGRVRPTTPRYWLGAFRIRRLRPWH